MDSCKNKTLLTNSKERNKENSAQSRGVVAIPVVVKSVVVRVPPAVVKVEVTHVQVAVRVAVMCRMSSMPLPLEYSWGCILLGIFNAITPNTKYLNFFEVSTYTTLNFAYG